MNILTTRKTLNKAFLKVKPQREEINSFKSELALLLDHINPTEHEEFNKNLLADFLKKTFQNNHFINTKGRNDLVIHQDKSPKSPVSVIIEAKRPDNSTEMPTQKNINSKAVQELILYYLRERIKEGNDKIKHLIVTDAQVWFVFDEQEFFKHFGSNKQLVKDFEAFERGVTSGTSTDYFYKNIAKPAIDKAVSELNVTYFDLRDFKKIVKSDNPQLDKKLIPLYKILSPAHLLKLPFANDSNTLDKKFYAELLHLIGLHEVGKSKKTIERLSEGKRNAGSLLENTIEKLDSTNKIRRLKNIKQYGETYAEQLEAVALELVITWVNRLLFLKLLEAQLISYHKGNTDYAFLNYDKLHDFDEVEVLFFEVLAKQVSDRSDFNNKAFGKVPYLNSSLFEPTELENATIEISGLRDRYELPLLSTTVLKDANGKRQTGNRNTLAYFFAFLDAYDFASEGTEDIQEQQKSIINASVLGLIFEKINGYKDGSFFTPGFITMYMCRETLRRAVLQKFNDAKGWNCQNINDLYNQIRDRKEANAIINSLKVCDPAVGSGHFLVSALNEMIAIKNDLDILQDENGKGFRDLHFKIENDELVVWDEQEDQLFQYNPTSKESTRIQKMLFHEKQTIIENCLFGVDINPNSVKICRLRLWIELLKNAYYKADNELETLPNIDINIKCGNSLISRYGLDADLKKALKKHKITITEYRNAVSKYRQAKTKAEKWQMLDLINTIKTDFKTSISANSKEQKQFDKLSQNFYYKYSDQQLFDVELTKAQEKKRKAEKAKLATKIAKLKTTIDEIKNNKIYQNAFEWRFEFPEVLDDDGNFIGFDMVIGNPPYLSGKSFKQYHKYFNTNYIVAEYQLDLYTMFIERSSSILNKTGYITLITPNSWLKNIRMGKTRQFILNQTSLLNINPNISNVFNDAQVDTCIFLLQKKIHNTNLNVWNFNKNYQSELKHKINQDIFSSNEDYVFDVEVSPKLRVIINKIRKQSSTLENVFDITRGINPYDKYRGQSPETIKSKAYHSNIKKDETFVPELRGKHISLFNYNWDKKHYISYGKWLAAPREPKYFQGERLLFREIISNRFVCTYINEEFIIDRSLYIAKPHIDNYETKYYLGILSSKLLIWLFKLEKNEFDVLFPKIRVKEFKKLPIPLTRKNETEITNLVNQILALKKSDPKADTSALESEIDQFVYGLYGLTAEEIAIVEAA